MVAVAEVTNILDDVSIYETFETYEEIMARQNRGRRAGDRKGSPNRTGSINGAHGSTRQVFTPVLNGEQIPDSWPSPGLKQTIDTSRGFFTGKRALVTGGFGFVGGHLARALHAAGARVAVLDRDTSPERGSQLNMTQLRDKMEVIEADITDLPAMKEIMAQGEFDFIFHLAAGATTIEKALYDPYDTIFTNTMGFVNVAEAVRQLPVDKRPVVLYSSTDKVYGESDDLPYVEEKSDLGGTGVYDAAKLAADILAGTYHKALGVPTIVLRMCNLFGPYDFNYNFRLVPKAMRNIFRDREAPDLYYNAIEHYRDYLYVEDAVRAFMYLAQTEACQGRVYNLPGTRYAATPDVLRDVIDAISDMQVDAMEDEPNSAFANLRWNRSIRIVKSDPRPIVISKQHLDGTRIRTESGFEPATGFRDGLGWTIAYYYWYFTQIAPGPPLRDELSQNGDAAPVGEPAPPIAQVTVLQVGASAPPEPTATQEPAPIYEILYPKHTDADVVGSETKE